MTDTLFIHLSSPDPAQPVMAALLSSDGSSLRAAFPSTLEALSAANSAATVVALVPGSSALSTVAVLPKVSSGQVRTMLPFALEEQIAGDLDQQHFAMGRPISTSGSSSSAGLHVPVVVIRRETLDQYLEVLRSVGLDPSALYLDESLIAAKPGDVIAWVQGEEVFLRSPVGVGLRCRAKDMPMSLDFLQSDPPFSTLGLQLVGLSDQSSIDLDIEALEARFARVQVTRSDGPVLDWLVAQRSIAEPINLLQGERKPRPRTEALVSRWRWAAALAAILFALVLIDYGNTWRSAAIEESALDQTLAQAGDLSASNGSIKPSRLRRALVDLAQVGVRDGAIVSIAIQENVVRVTLRNANAVETSARALEALGWRVDSSVDDQGRAQWTLIELEVSP